jgi:hypothetical protein
LKKKNGYSAKEVKSETNYLIAFEEEFLIQNILEQ